MVADIYYPIRTSTGYILSATIMHPTLLLCSKNWWVFFPGSMQTNVACHYQFVLCSDLLWWYPLHSPSLLLVVHPCVPGNHSLLYLHSPSFIYVPSIIYCCLTCAMICSRSLSFPINPVEFASPVEVWAGGYIIEGERGVWVQQNYAAMAGAAYSMFTISFVVSW